MNEVEKKELFYLRLITILLGILTIFVIVFSIYFMINFMKEITLINDSIQSLKDALDNLNIDGDTIEKLTNLFNKVSSFF